jgi:hypothetical protein
VTDVTTFDGFCIELAVTSSAFSVHKRSATELAKVLKRLSLSCPSSKRRQSFGKSCCRKTVDDVDRVGEGFSPQLLRQPRGSSQHRACHFRQNSKSSLRHPIQGRTVDWTSLQLDTQLLAEVRELSMNELTSVIRANTANVKAFSKSKSVDESCQCSSDVAARLGCEKRA